MQNKWVFSIVLWNDTGASPMFGGDIRPANCWMNSQLPERKSSSSRVNMFANMHNMFADLRYPSIGWFISHESFSSTDPVSFLQTGPPQLCLSLYKPYEPHYLT